MNYVEMVLTIMVMDSLMKIVGLMETDSDQVLTVADNCPNTWNPSQASYTVNGFGDTIFSNRLATGGQFACQF